MKDLKVFTAVIFIVCLFIGIGLSMLLDNSEKTFQTLDGEEFGFFVDHQEIESSIFDAAFDASFHARVNVAFPGEIRTVTSLINIYEEGEHVAQYPSGALIFDDDFLFEGDYVDFATGGMNNLEENDDGYYWTQVIKVTNGSLRSGVDLRMKEI
ncbi:hypothetical protein [Salipaludibacillus sp. CF4.18]|uniref:hypothetical protein n=1 Tax=Salipaludibacillus sp. CF4.18 TaxID=3373081 RepID=UPI003EE57476